MEKVSEKEFDDMVKHLAEQSLPVVLRLKLLFNEEKIDPVVGMFSAIRSAAIISKQMGESSEDFVGWVSAIAELIWNG